MYQATVVKRNKTETRRTHGLSKVNEWPLRWSVSKSSLSKDGFLEVKFMDVYSPDLKKAGELIVKSKYKVGEVLYIAEPLYIMDSSVVNNNLRLGKITHLDIPHLYAYDMTDVQKEAASVNIKQKLWKKISPLFMRQQYGRKFIKIREIWVERVQDITRDSIFNEGVIDLSSLEGEKNNLSNEFLRTSYASLFDKVNTVGLWDKNVFIFVYSYEFLPDYKRSMENA